MAFAFEMALVPKVPCRSRRARPERERSAWLWRPLPLLRHSVHLAQKQQFWHLRSEGLGLKFANSVDRVRKLHVPPSVSCFKVCLRAAR